ncbi:T9SS type A sorting domain-containing protein [Bizionia myxarmorum]|uniref:T9SS type A sorting domain-containing protein n=1 Tax=Bizionia myxarmorum TaxID=291186 RepID=A0A5D0RAV1_9FLAO|nr:T9SS type A sorting domain-containing protein [Bizionia myxarmorum]TYB78493.1 T9SS type A sorting domain-containing protein [Bizionia myxarmorum]
MKKFIIITCCLILAVGFTQAQTYQNNTVTAPAVAENRLGGCGFKTQPGVQMSEITVPISGTILDPSKITINMGLTADWLGDVVVDLVSPSGEAITLIRRIGAGTAASCGDSSKFAPTNILGFNSENIDLIDAASIPATADIPSGNYLPTLSSANYPSHSPIDMTTYFNGKELNGKWTLVLYDYGVGELAILNFWQIIVAAGATLTTDDGGVYGNEASLKQNPVQDYILLDVPGSFNTLNFDIYDVTGKLVQKASFSSYTNDIRIHASNLSSGMYILRPTKDGEPRQPIKFIKK